MGTKQDSNTFITLVTASQVVGNREFNTVSSGARSVTGSRHSVTIPGSGERGNAWLPEEDFWPEWFLGGLSSGGKSEEQPVANNEVARSNDSKASFRLLG